MKKNARKSMMFLICLAAAVCLLVQTPMPSQAAPQQESHSGLQSGNSSSSNNQLNQIRGRRKTPTPIRRTPTATRVIPTATATRISPTATRVIPTATRISPTATRVIPTATATRVSPTATQVNPTAAPTQNTPTATRASPTPGSTPAAGNVYYVAANGNDANPGTESQPWRTITKAARTAVAGMTVYVRAGVYAEQVILSRSGTQDSPIQFLAYPGETPVIEGSNLSIANWSSMLTLSGNWIIVSGFEVRNSPYIGVELSGQHNVVDNVFSHHSRETGILARGDYSTVRNSRIWRSALNNEYGAQSGGGWASGLSAARDNVDGKTDYAVLSNNTSWENWGEGVSSFEANGTRIEGNVAYDNYSTNIYISDTTNAWCEGNLVYNTPSSYTTGYGAHVGIMMGDEVYRPASSNNTVINNIAYGNKRNFFWWQGGQGGGLVNTLIANNTFVNSTTEASVVINSGSHQNARFINNLVVQDGALPVAVFDSPLTVVSNNLWSKTPGRNAAGAGDVIGDPLLAKTGSLYAPDWYRLLDGSPAVDKALQLAEITRDYGSSPRGSAPDLGAFEK